MEVAWPARAVPSRSPADCVDQAERRLEGARWLARHLSLHFECTLEEHAFAEHLRPRIAARTLLCQGCAVAVQAAVLVRTVLREVLREGDGTAPTAPFSSGLLAFGGLFLSQLAVDMFLLSMWLTRAAHINWEAWGVAMTAMLCAVWPWANPWHAAVLLGADPSEVFGRWGASPAAAEEASVIGAFALAAAFSAFVPVRLALLPVVPFFAALSYMLLLGTVGSQDPATSLVRLALLALLLALPASKLRRLEVLERRQWLSEQQPWLSEPKAEPAIALGAAAPSEFDLTLRLTEACTLTRTSRVVHDGFFGQSAEGLLFTSFLQRDDRLRFQEALELASLSSQPESTRVTLHLGRGAVVAQLCVATVPFGGDGEAALHSSSAPSSRIRFVVSLRIIEERRTTAPSSRVVTWGSSSVYSGFGGPSESPPDSGDEGDDTGEIDWGKVISVPEDKPLSAVHHPGAIMVEGCDGMSPLNSRSSRGRRRMATGESSSDAYRGSGKFLALPASSCYPVCPTNSGPAKTEDSLWYSVTTEDRLSYDPSWKKGGPPMLATCTGSLHMPSTVDAAVNTNIVMEEFGFRCIACSKPPKSPRFYDPDGCAPVLPGPEAQALIAKLDRKKGVARDHVPVWNIRHYTGARYNGCWEAVWHNGVVLNDWLERIKIHNGRCLLGDGDEAMLVQYGDNEDGCVFLLDGEVALRRNGRLARAGRSGVVVEFIHRGPWEPEDAMASSLPAYCPDDDRQSLAPRERDGSSEAEAMSSECSSRPASIT